ncbi:hypothetical protein [Nocardioides pelophilus]|uniref:hypothetical protein n=1 Tax=Nocardioides pelophilus TaxID=2172019 RepID=UPI0016009C17|nr:hypothetical protein [Nocardioides pelophilus]
MTVDRVERTWAPGVVRSLAGALLLLVGGCAPSAESLEEKVKDEPGVITVEVMEGGDDDLPFTRIPKSAWVLKEPDASADEVMSVFDKYDDDIDDDVDLVQVRL